MVTSPWLTAALGAASILLSAYGAVAVTGYSLSASPSYDLHLQVIDSRNGNWTEFDCMHPLTTTGSSKYTPSERWEGLNADAAWRDVVRIWRETKYGNNFMASVTVTLKVGRGAHCGDITRSTCVWNGCPNGANGPKSGPAAPLIWNSLVAIHRYHKVYYDTLYGYWSALISGTDLQELESAFALVSPEADEETWNSLFNDLLALGSLSTAGSFFNTQLKKLPYFVQKGRQLDNTKEITIDLIRNNTNIARNVFGINEPSWMLDTEGNFSDYMGKVVRSWADVGSSAARQLFSGSEETLEIMWSTISDGKLADGKLEGAPLSSVNARDELKAQIGKSFYGYVIPALWRVSKTYAFIIDSGYGCHEGRPLSDCLKDDTMNATGVCFEDKQYYLVYPDKGNKFSTPPGLDLLPSYKFGGINKEDLVQGSVRTWIDNGHENRAGFMDPFKEGTIEDLVDGNITTGGFMRIPVCSLERAFQSWKTGKKGSSDFYPCDIPPGKDTCRESTFEDQTSDASPSVNDCLTIITNIEGDASTDYTHQIVGMRHRKIPSFGSCSFGVEATKVDGNVNFVVGGQDVIDIIRESVKKFSRDGKVGAKGEMKCNGNIKDQPIKWGIY